MQRQLLFTEEAAEQLQRLKSNPAKKGLYRQVLNTLGLLELNTKHPGLHTHEYQSLIGANGERIWEAFVQNQTPGAYRVFFHYGPDTAVEKRRIPILTVVAIVAHP